MHIFWRYEINSLGTILELLAFSDMLRLNIMLYNSLDSKEWYWSIDNSRNKTSVSILLLNSNMK